jgi:hypothetical protein
LQKSNVMRLTILYFTSLLFTALSLAPAMAHLLALPNKIRMGAGDYFTVQQIYKGWSLLGILLVLALISNLLLAFITRRNAALFFLNGGAFLCMLTGLGIFFLFTFPANQQTNNWTKLPKNWETLRRNWEYSHAVNAFIFLIALILLIISVLHKIHSTVSTSITR